MNVREKKRGALLLGVSLVLGTPLARADPPESAPPFTVSLDYAAPDGCPEVDVLEHVVSSRLGYAPFSARAAARVQVLISRDDTGSQGLLIWRDSAGHSTGQQTFPSRSNDCAELVAALGFALAVQIQLLATTEPAHTEAPPTPPTREPPEKTLTAAPEPPRSAPPARAQRPKPPRSLALTAGGGVGLGFGMTARTAPLARLFGALSWPRFAFELAAEASLPETTRRADGAGYSQRNVLGSVAGCGLYQRWSACLGLRAGAVSVQGQAIDAPRSASSALLQSGLRLAIKQDLGQRAYLSARVEGLVNWTRWTVTLDQLGVWTSPRLAYLGGLDFGVLLFE